MRGAVVSINMVKSCCSGRYGANHSTLKEILVAMRDTADKKPLGFFFDKSLAGDLLGGKVSNIGHRIK